MPTNIQDGFLWPAPFTKTSTSADSKLHSSRSQRHRSDSVSLTCSVKILRDSLDVTTWVTIGAVLQSAAFLAIGRLAFVPAVALLMYRILEAYAITTGLATNPYMKDVVMEKYSAQFPDSRGQYGDKASNNDVAVLLLGTQSNQYVVPSTCASSQDILFRLITDNNLAPWAPSHLDSSR